MAMVPVVMAQVLLPAVSVVVPEVAEWLLLIWQLSGV